MRRPNLSARTRALLVLALIAVTTVAVQLSWVAPPLAARAADGSYEPRVIGQVTGPDGEPIAGAELRIGREAIHRGDYGRTRWSRQDVAATDDGGRFELQVTYPHWMASSKARVGVSDELWLSVTASGFAPSLVRLPEAVDGVVRTDIELGQGAVISGVAADENGDPAPGVRIELSPALDDSARTTYPPLFPYLVTPIEAETDTEGRFEVARLPPGDYVVRAHAEGRLAPVRLVRAPGTATFTVSTPISASGRVTNHQGVPLDASLRWSHADSVASVGGSQPGFTHDRGTDLGGWFFLPRIAAGRWNVLVSPHRDGEPSRRLTVELDGEDEVRLQLPPPVPWRGRLLDGTGRPIAGQAITLSSTAGRCYGAGATTAKDGGFTALRTEDGLHSVELWRGGLTVVASGFDPSEPLHVRLTGSGTLEVAVPDHVRVQLSLTPVDSTTPRRFTYSVDTQGKYGPGRVAVFEHLADVDHELRVEPASCYAAMQRFERVGPATRVVPAGTERVVVEYRSTHDER